MHPGDPLANVAATCYENFPHIQLLFLYDNSALKFI
jgi:hypothetical protein